MHNHNIELCWNKRKSTRRKSQRTTQQKLQLSSELEVEVTFIFYGQVLIFLGLGISSLLQLHDPVVMFSIGCFKALLKLGISSSQLGELFLQSFGTRDVIC